MNIPKRFFAAPALAALLIVCFGMIAPKPTSALSGSDFSASRIIDDAIFFNSNTMNTGDIQNFFKAKVPVCDTNGTLPKNGVSGQTRAQWAAANGEPGPPYTCLKDYSQSFSSVTADAYCGAISGGTKSAADIVFNVSRACGINPQSLIVLLQKEQALVTDDWPLPVQYRSATGYGCPDTAVCDSQYYGFFNQVYNAGHQFKRYAQNSSLFNYAIGRASAIAYQANNSSCGSSVVTPQTRATAALYNYTPYQPNQAALNNLYGLGDSCSAYGNRNFWRTFNDWFGPTQIDSFTIAVSNDSNQNQYLLFGGLKQAIPDPATKIAWGLQDYPLVTMPTNYLSTIPSGPPLDRLTRLNTSDQTVFFMDGGKRYRVMSQAMFNAWNFGGRPITNVPPALFYLPADGGQLTYTVRDPNSAATYTVDGANNNGTTVIRPFASDTVRKAWEGDTATYTSVSANFFDSMNDAVGSTLSSTNISSNGSTYQVLNGARFLVPSSYGSFYPGAAQAVSMTTINRLFAAGQASNLMRMAGDGTVYLIDNGTKRVVANPSVLVAWTPPGASVEVVNSNYASLIPNGAALDSYATISAGQLYVLNGYKLAVPTNLQAAYQGLSALSVSAQLLSIYPQSGSVPTGFIKSVSSPDLFLLDNSGQKRHVNTSDKATLLGAYTTGVTVLPDSIVAAMPVAVSPQVYVSDGTIEYMIENGTKYSVSPSVKADWGLSNPQVYTDGTLTRFPTGAPLGSKLRDGNNYFLIKGGRAFLTVDINIADAWGIADAPQMSKTLITSQLSYYMLTRFVHSTTDSRTFVIDHGQWYNVSDLQLANLGGVGAPIMGLEPTSAPNTITDWTSVVVQDSTGKHYVIDGGTKRSFASPIIQNQWTNYHQLSVPTTSNGFLNLLPNNGTIERAIKGSSPSIYSAENGIKRHVLYANTFNLSYAPFCVVSDMLIYAMPTGSDIQ